MSHRRPQFSLLRPQLAGVLLGCATAILAGCGGPGTNGAGLRSDAETDAVESLQIELAAVRAEAALTPAEVYWVYREGELLVALDSLDLAEQSLKRALELDHQYAPALSLQSKLDYDAGRNEAAIARLEAVATERSLPPELQIALGLHYEAAGNFDASDSLFEQVQSDHNSVAYYALRSDDLDRAREVAERSLRENPDSAASHNDFGITRLYAGDPQEAREHFLRALELDERHLGALYNLAIVETYYLLDDSAGRSWFDRYQGAGGHEDPDGLTNYFAGVEERQARR